MKQTHEEHVMRSLVLCEYVLSVALTGEQSEFMFLFGASSDSLSEADVKNCCLTRIAHYILHIVCSVKVKQKQQTCSRNQSTGDLLYICSQVCVTDAMSQLTLTFEVEKNNKRGWAIQVFKFCFTKRLQKSYSKILLEQKKFLVLIIVSKNSEWDEMTEK